LSIIYRYGRRAALQKTLLVSLLLPGAAAAQGRGQAPIRLLALGDSLTAGFGLPRGEGFVAQLQAALRAEGRAVQVQDAGVSGDTMAGGASRLEWALADRPQAAIVALGGNDGLRGLPVAPMGRALASILDRLAARQIPTLLAGMHAPPNLGGDYTRAFQTIFTDAANRRDNIIFYPFFLEGVAGDPALNQADGIHPNARGVAEMVRRILPATEELLDRVAPAPAG
jgi:acyl-CoA thioesterase-1